MVLGALFAVSACACTGELSERGPRRDAPQAASPSGGSGDQVGPDASGGGGGGGVLPEGSGGLPGGCASAPQPITRVARLTHAQYDNTVQHLLASNASFAGTFQPDPSFGSFNNAADDLRTVDRLGRDYRRAAEALAAATANDENFRAGFPECQGGELSACGAAFVRAFGLRAFRRPLTSAEQARFQAAFMGAGGLLQGADPVADGIQLVVEAMLQSPKFLYRVELGDAVPLADGTLPLSDHELATRLSYLIWNSMPDPALFAAATAGSLSAGSGVREQAARMVEDTRARATVADFHRQWLHADRFSNASADPAVFPQFTAAAIRGLPTELELFVGELFDRQRPALEVLTASFSYVDASLAALYGLPGSFGESFERVELNPSQRSGLFTQLGFLASHSHATATSPIHRGVAVLKDVLCVKVPPPPGNVDLTFPAFDDSIRTTRDQVTAHTSKPECAACHAQIINPVGFAFENYDPSGSYRTTERDTQVDATGQVLLDGNPVAFKDAVEFLQSVAASTEGRSCYAQKWLQYGYARPPVLSDACTTAAVAQSLAGPDYSFRKIFLDLVGTPSFLRRAAD
jgi:hypothetical protein